MKGKRSGSCSRNLFESSSHSKGSVSGTDAGAGKDTQQKPGSKGEEKFPLNKGNPERIGGSKEVESIAESLRSVVVSKDKKTTTIETKGKGKKAPRSGKYINARKLEGELGMR